MCVLYIHMIWSYHEKIRTSAHPPFCISAFPHFAFLHVASSAFRISETSTPKPLRRNLHAETFTPKPLRRNLHAETSTPKPPRRNLCAARISHVGIYSRGHMQNRVKAWGELTFLMGGRSAVGTRPRRSRSEVETSSNQGRSEAEARLKRGQSEIEASSK